MGAYMRILLLDIETAPNIAHVWGLWNVNVSINQLQASSYVMCVAWKWLGEDEVYFDSVKKTNAKNMLKRIHAAMNEADAIIHYNGNSFDIPTLNKEFLLYKMKPPAPSRQIDLLRTSRSRFRFPSNKLDYVAKKLGLGGKVKHAGHELWVRCLANESAAWKEMENYNKRDVTLLEEVYHRLLPWIKNHPNHNLHGDTNGCINCGADKLQRRGVSRSATGVFDRYQCQACGKWQRGEKQRAASNLMREAP